MSLATAHEGGSVMLLIAVVTKGLLETPNPRTPASVPGSSDLSSVPFVFPSPGLGG